MGIAISFDLAGGGLCLFPSYNSDTGFDHCFNPVGHPLWRIKGHVSARCMIAHKLLAIVHQRFVHLILLTSQAGS